MAKKDESVETVEMQKTCEYLRSELMSGFDSLKTLKESGEITDADLDYELARDRKAGLVLKTMIVEMNTEKLRQKRIS